jgi:L-aspartate oxidase
MVGFVADSIAGWTAASLPAQKPVALPPAPDAGSLRTFVGETLGLVRDRAGLEAALARLQPLAFRSGAAAEPALVALLIATAALAREESRGGHWRADFPQPSAAWMRRFVQRIDETGTRVICRAVPLPNASQPLARGA